MTSAPQMATNWISRRNSNNGSTMDLGRKTKSSLKNKSRIPLDLQAVLLAANRGEDVPQAPPSAFQVFPHVHHKRVSSLSSSSDIGATGVTNNKPDATEPGAGCTSDRIVHGSVKKQRQPSLRFADVHNLAEFVIQTAKEVETTCKPKETATAAVQIVRSEKTKEVSPPSPTSCAEVYAEELKYLSAAPKLPTRNSLYSSSSRSLPGLLPRSSLQHRSSSHEDNGYSNIDEYSQACNTYFEGAAERLFDKDDDDGLSMSDLLPEEIIMRLEEMTLNSSASDGSSLGSCDSSSWCGTDSPSMGRGKVQKPKSLDDDSDTVSITSVASLSDDIASCACLCDKTFYSQTSYTIKTDFTRRRSNQTSAQRQYVDVKKPTSPRALLDVYLERQHEWELEANRTDSNILPASQDASVDRHISRQGSSNADSNANGTNRTSLSSFTAITLPSRHHSRNQQQVFRILAFQVFWISLVVRCLVLAVFKDDPASALILFVVAATVHTASGISWQQLFFVPPVFSKKQLLNLLVGNKYHRRRRV